MGRTYTSLTYHLIFSTKYRRKLISPNFKDRLYEYIGGIIRQKNGVLLEIGGIEDHIHLLAGFPPTITVSDMLRFIKSNSSKWINELPEEEFNGTFAWQPGFGAFTVSYSQQPVISKYIQNQHVHNLKRTFKEEFLKILGAHQIEYDPRYVFEDEHFG